ncbi:MAG: hypothetical protein KatS3mg056_1410 [Chloroflexus sp.]|jgi:hypothetical protein|nr:MAG: hypothetical protein KatS3mg056_1410 [Chloroflexus sp.]
MQAGSLRHREHLQPGLTQRDMWVMHRRVQGYRSSPSGQPRRGFHDLRQGFNPPVPHRHPAYALPITRTYFIKRFTVALSQPSPVPSCAGWVALPAHHARVATFGVWQPCCRASRARDLVRVRSLTRLVTRTPGVIVIHDDVIRGVIPTAV